MTRPADGPPGRRRWAAALLALVAIALFACLVLELRLSGPAGSSLTLLYRTTKDLVRDAVVPTAPVPVRDADHGPSAIVIVLDCFRADYVGPRTPHLEELAQGSWRFDRHYASSTWTKPSTASLYTGLIPSKHGVNFPGGTQLPDELVTMAELARDHGFATGGFVQGVHLTRVQNFQQGFDTYEDRGLSGSKALVSEFFRWLDERRPERFLAYLHFLGTHDPYNAGAGFRDVLAAPRYRGDLDLWRTGYLKQINEEGAELGADGTAHLRFLAEAKAARVDRRAMGRFLDLFERSGLADETLLIVTSDHGDSFLEHGRVSHAGPPFEPEIHVPMLMRLPEPLRAARGLPAHQTIGCPTSTVDILPTLIDYFGIETDWVGDGLSLLDPELRAEECDRPVISEQLMEGGWQRAVIQGRHKLFVDESTGDHRLFDLDADPEERVDLSVERPDLVARALEARARIERTGGADMTGIEPPPEAEVPDELLRRMRYLGYVDE